MSRRREGVVQSTVSRLFSAEKKSEHIVDLGGCSTTATAMEQDALSQRRPLEPCPISPGGEPKWPSAVDAGSQNELGMSGFIINKDCAPAFFFFSREDSEPS
jgi:hypothetical protein